jgi:uncharacterized membrane protein
MFTLFHGLHLLAIAVAVGGTIVLRFVVCPFLGSDEAGKAARQAILGRWRPIVWFTIAVIVGTGLANTHQAYMRVGPNMFYWGIFLVKFFLALALFGIAFLLTLPMEAFAKFKEQRDKWMRHMVEIGTIILFISAYLRLHYPHLPAPPQ